ncbi:MAG: SoxR reducing system RseC family protein [Prevotella sp.]|nr:SoxR reducing system RseC family protein [Prevotella sp.]MBR1412218.1 SoxR reducing system RseC family protein [Prevotella sp.]
MSNKIKHSGVVENIVGDCVSVRIVQTSACAACKVASHCNAAESKEKLVDVRCSNSAAYKKGQQVVVTASTEVAARALLLGFGLPFVVLVSVLFIVLQVSGNEALAALSGLAALLPYYVALYLFRNRIREQLSFAIE